jgi:predicted nuclease of restriction endonuclease-like (RecB) superfamily
MPKKKSTPKKSIAAKPKSAVRSAKSTGTALYGRIRQILESARSHVARTVNSTQVVANWLVGYILVKDKQAGESRAEYGKELLKGLSLQLQKEFGSGYSVDNLELFRRFYLEYPDLISDAPRRISDLTGDLPQISEAMHRKSKQKQRAVRDESNKSGFLHAPSGKTGDSWAPGTLSPDLSWTHYRALLKVKTQGARAFYEIEAAKNHWSARELERQINSLLFERLAKSRDKKGLKALANKGLEPASPIDAIKDPYVLEFLDLPESHRLVESKLEEALITRLADFLLELGTGFAFVARQKRLTLDGDYFYSDLVFYHVKLKCYLVIDLKTAKLTHGDLGQMQMYVHYYDREVRSKDDNPTIGLILCTAKNDAMVKYVLDDKNKQIFASRYQFNLPTEEELKAELKHEMQQLGLPAPKKKTTRKRKTK